jgi:hypothetical protein
VIVSEGFGTGNEVRLGATPTTSAFSAEEGRDDDVYVGELGRVHVRRERGGDTRLG